jgi:carbon-monoxide dehydrogenase large subunit
MTDVLDKEAPDSAPLSPDDQERTDKLEGIGCKRKRTEDLRFTQGRGNYVDDVVLPGMLFGDFARSPYAHARIKKIDKDSALKVEGVLAVITAEDLIPLNLHYMPTLAGDVQAVLAHEKVLFQNQEVAFIVAKDRYAAADGAEALDIEYEELPPLVDPFKAMEEDAPVLREDIKDKTEGAHGPRKHYNHIFTWSAGDAEATEAAFAKADVTVKQYLAHPRVHPCPLETCGSVAHMDKARDQLTLYGTFQAPHVVRTVASLIAGIPEHKIRVIAPDIGGGFGNKVGVYPGYVLSIVASIVTGKPVKWIEDRMENLSTTAFARDYHITGELAATKDGKILGMRAHVLADHGAFDACADPTKYPAGMYHICTGSYDIPAAFCEVEGVYTNKAPGGVSYRCSFRVTEAVYTIERMVEVLAQELGMDSAELRKKNLIQPEQMPYTSAMGWEYDSGDYPTAFNKALEAVEYDKLRAEQGERLEAFKRGETRELMGIGVCFFTEIVGAGPSKNCDILGIGMFDSCEIRVHPTGAAIARMGTKTQGQGHETTYAQILATETGIPASMIAVEEGDTDTAPYGLGTYGSRSTPVAGAACARAGRKIKHKAQMIASHLLEVHHDDLEWDVDGFKVKGAPDKRKSMQEIAWAAYNNVPPGMEMGLEAVDYYDPPNFTFPYGAYICVLDIDVDTGETKVRRFYALDDCGTRINPMVIEGQVHGGLTEAFAVAMGQLIDYDEQGNVQGASLMDFFLPTAVETPYWELDHTEVPSPHHPIGAKGVGESPHVGGVPAFSNAVNDAFLKLGGVHTHMPHTAANVWAHARELGLIK